MFLLVKFQWSFVPVYMYVSVIHDLLLHNCHLELSGMASIATKSISDASIV